MTCPHLWDIEEARGPLSKAVCKLCGETKVFSNSMAVDMYRNYEVKFITPFSPRSARRPTPSDAYYASI